MDPPVVRRIREANDELLSEMEGIERLVAGPVSGTVFRCAFAEVRRQLAAHVAVDGELVLETLRARGGAAPEILGRLRREHHSLLCRAVELESGARPSRDLPRFARALRDHLERETGLLAPAGPLLSGIPAWRADELYERAGGPTEYWVERWLG